MFLSCTSCFPVLLLQRWFHSRNFILNNFFQRVFSSLARLRCQSGIVDFFILITISERVKKCLVSASITFKIIKAEEGCWFLIKHTHRSYSYHCCLVITVVMIVVIIFNHQQQRNCLILVKIIKTGRCLYYKQLISMWLKCAKTTAWPKLILPGPAHVRRLWGLTFPPSLTP